MRVIDAHIHLDQYAEKDAETILSSLDKNHVDALMTVSMNLASCQKNLRFSEQNANVYSAFGWHPEQPLPTERELDTLVDWIRKHADKMVAVGEVGLPYYLREKEGRESFPYSDYVEILERFILLAKELDKPIVLHAVYDDAPVVCDLLEKHEVSKAHFHWFKGDLNTLGRMKDNGYFISLTPDILYEDETRLMATHYPLSLLMAETDGPWAFEGIFHQRMTLPSMVHEVVKEVAAIKKLKTEEAYSILYENVKRFLK